MRMKLKKWHKDHHLPWPCRLITLFFCPNDDDPIHFVHRQGSLTDRSKIISPLSRFFVGWTFLIVLCLLYIIVMQPLEAAYLDRHLLKEGQPLMVITRAMDVIFIIDIWINFRTGYFDDKETEIRDPQKVARRYLRTWFLLDFLSSMPPVLEVLLMLMTGAKTSGIQTAKVLKIGRIFKALKVLRFSKLVKLTDSNSPFMDQIEDFASTSYSKFLGKIIFILFFSFALGHILSCGAGIAGDGWFRTYSQDHPDADHRNADGWSWQRRYILGLYWSFATMSTVGFGDVVPASDNERIYSIAALIFGVSFYSYIVASVSSMVTASDAKSQVYYEKMDAISSWIAHHKLSRELCHRIRLHFRQHYYARTALDEKEILGNLSPQLADEVTSCLLSGVVLEHPLFEWLPSGNAWKVLLICKREQVLPGDVVIDHAQLTSSLFILVKGHADCEVGDDAALPSRRVGSSGGGVLRKYVIGPGASFGELAVLGIYHTSPVRVIARTRCNLCRIQQDALLKAFRPMPEVLAKMRSVAAPGGCRIVHP